MQIVAISISLCALLGSLVALWRTHLAPPRVRVVAGQGTLSIDPIETPERSWYMPRLTVPVAVNNVGARTVYVTNARLRARYPKNPSPDAWEIFHLMYEINPEKYASLESGEVRLLRRAFHGPGVPFAVGAGKFELKHLVFTTRWDYQVVEKEACFELQLAYEGKSTWVTCATFEKFPLDVEYWSNVENGSLAVVPIGQTPSGHWDRNPRNLHLDPPTNGASET